MPTLYTGKGDEGTTRFFGACDQKRVSKSSFLAEALGDLDELNSFLGLLKTNSVAKELKIGGGSLAETIEAVQQNVFTLSARLAGAEKNLSPNKLAGAESIIAECEKELPPIKTFSLSGGTELSALLDFARALARRAERRVVAVSDESGSVPSEILAYLNRLSSLLFALARLVNFRAGAEERAPSYE